MATPKQILSLGLSILPMMPTALQNFAEALQHRKPVEGIHYCTILMPRLLAERLKSTDREAGLKYERNTSDCHIYWQIDNTWLLRVWESHPGPGERDFVCFFNEITKLLDATVEYYFGNPT